MIEIYDDARYNKRLIYVTTDEKDLVDRLFKIKDASAFYYHQGRKVAYHWLVDGGTLGKLDLTAK